MSKYFAQVDVKKYVDRQIEYGLLKPFLAKKLECDVRNKVFLEEQRINTNLGLLETTSSMTTPISSSSNTITIKIENEETLMKDEFVLDNSSVTVQQFVEVLENITFTSPKGEQAYLLAGGYLNITNPEAIYGMSREDFEETYQIQEKSKSKKIVK